MIQTISTEKKIKCFFCDKNFYGSELVIIDVVQHYINDHLLEFNAWCETHESDVPLNKFEEVI